MNTAPQNTAASAPCPCGHCCTRVENLSVRLGGRDIIRDISMHIHCSEILAIIGPNGAGKTTFLKALLSEVRFEGGISFLSAGGTIQRRPRIGYVPQHLYFDRGAPITVLELFAACNTPRALWTGVSKKQRALCLESLQRVEADRLIDRRLGALSGGELQRVLLALGMQPVPELLLLDEPVSGVDSRGMQLFYETVDKIRQSYDLAVLLVSHDLHMVKRFAQRVALINGALVADGPPGEVFQSESFRSLFSEVD